MWVRHYVSQALHAAVRKRRRCVKVLEVDKQGRIRLSIKAVTDGEGV